MNFLVVERLRLDPAAPILRLRRFAEVEVGVGITVLFIAASITSLPPAIYLTTDRVTLAEYAERLTLRMPSFSTPAQASLALAELQAKLDTETAQGAPTASAYVPGAGLPPPRNAANIAWSEYNHHWAGVFVLVMPERGVVDQLAEMREADPAGGEGIEQLDVAEGIGEPDQQRHEHHECQQQERRAQIEIRLEARRKPAAAPAPDAPRSRADGNRHCLFFASHSCWASVRYLAHWSVTSLAVICPSRAFCEVSTDITSKR